MKVETPGIQIQEDGNIISVTLPPSQHSWTVIVTRGIISNNVCVAENKPTGPSTTIYSSPLSTRANMSSSNDTAEPGFDLPIKSSGAEGSAFHAATKIIEGDSASGFGNMLTTNLRRPSLDVATIDAGMGMLSLEGRVSAPIPPSRVDPPSHLRDCPSCEQFRVSKDVQTRYPPWLIGWKTGLSWIVVIRGRDVGVFHEFWARIWPLIKFPNDDIIPGAHWKKADGKDDAFRKWQSAVEEDAVDRIGGIYVGRA